MNDEGPVISELLPLDELNAAAPLSRLGTDAMPVGSFYTRSNFEIPSVDPDTWRLTVSGLVGDPMILSMSELRSLGESTELVTLECAGNGRIYMDPVPDGAPWGLGAVSVAEFTGTPLARVLRASNPSAEVVEFVFTGLDRGRVEPEGDINYAFSLTAGEAASVGPMLVWAMNGEPLTAEHGAPLRLVAPGAYGMASVKWLTSITARSEPFTGHFRMKYRYLGDPIASEGERVGPMRVRSLIAAPLDAEDVAADLEVRGAAWSGSGTIESVAVRIDDGDWLEAEIGAALGRFAPTPWSMSVRLDPGSHAIVSRATDSAGNVQPLESIWNANGYANNVVQTVMVRVLN